MNIKLNLAKLMGISVLALATSIASAEVVVVANANSDIGQTDDESVRKLFLGKSSYIGGVEAVPVDQSEGNDARDEFYAKVVQKTDAQLNAYWSRLIFTAKGSPPKQYFDDAEVVEVILEDEEAVGYIDTASITEGLKVIYTPQ